MTVYYERFVKKLYCSLQLPYTAQERTVAWNLPLLAAGGLFHLYAGEPLGGILSVLVQLQVVRECNQNVGGPIAPDGA